jgi:TRAP-type mannitol/chloroaromatic compound transport system permease small subunit
MSNPGNDIGAWIDRISITTGRIASWLTLAMVLVTFVIVKNKKGEESISHLNSYG